MRKLLLALSFLGAFSLSAAPRPLIASSQDHSVGEFESCDNFHTRNSTSLPAQVNDQEQRDIRLHGVDVLRIRTSEAGGIAVRGWDKSFARVTMCRFAAATSIAEAHKLLTDVAVTYSDGTILAEGPDSGEAQAWWVHMIIDVPRKTNVDVETLNGGIAVRQLRGRVAARATNGSISLAGCAGESRVSTENGGISIERMTGRVEAVTQNGPIALKLNSGASKVPAIEARVTGDGEIVCNLQQCGAWGSDRKSLRIGNAPASIRLSTARAPIMIENVR